MKKLKNKTLLYLFAVIFIVVISILIAVFVSNKSFENCVQKDIDIKLSTSVDEFQNLNVEYTVDNNSDYDVSIMLKNEHIHNGEYFDLQSGEGDTGVSLKKTTKVFSSIIETDDYDSAKEFEKNLNGIYTIKIYENLKNNRSCEFEKVIEQDK